MTDPDELPSVDDLPVAQDALKVMKLDLAVSDLGEVYVFHEKAMPEPVNWVEYDQSNRKLYFISKSGRIQSLGMDVKNRMNDVIAQARRIFLIHRENGENKTAFEMPLVHQIDSTL